MTPTLQQGADAELPPLPPAYRSDFPHTFQELYSADQMRKYARVAVAASVTAQVAPAPITPASDTDANDICQLPPAGWYCTRQAGHEGPCAAHPHEPDRELNADDHAAIAKGMERIRAAQPLAASAVPEGFALVPKEPTDAMLNAADAYSDRCCDYMLKPTAKGYYAYMLAAAPSQQPAIPSKFESRRFCKGDNEWTDWQPASQEFYNYHQNDPTVEFRPSQQPAASKVELTQKEIDWIHGKNDGEPLIYDASQPAASPTEAK